jgi:hypothetical protein
VHIFPKRFTIACPSSFKMLTALASSRFVSSYIAEMRIRIKALPEPN